MSVVFFHILLHLSCIMINFMFIYIDCNLTNGFSIQYFVPPAIECTDCWHSKIHQNYQPKSYNNEKTNFVQYPLKMKRDNKQSLNDVLFLYIILLNVRQVCNGVKAQFDICKFALFHIPCVVDFFYFYIFVLMEMMCDFCLGFF